MFIPFRSGWLIYLFVVSIAMVLFAQELEQSSGDSSWLYGIPNV